MSKKRTTQNITKASRSNFKIKKTENSSSFAKGSSLTQKERFDALNLKIKHPGQGFNTKLSAFKNIRKESASNNQLDPSLERSLEKLNNLESYSKADYLASR